MHTTSKAAAMAGALALGGMLGMGSPSAFAQIGAGPAASAPELFAPTSSPASAAAAPARGADATALSMDDLPELPATSSAPPLASRRDFAPTTNGATAIPRTNYAYPNMASPAARPPAYTHSAANGTPTYAPSGTYPASFAGQAGPNGATASYATAAPSQAMMGASRASLNMPAIPAVAPPAAANVGMGAPSNDPGYAPVHNQQPGVVAGAMPTPPSGPGSQYWTSSSPPTPPRKPSRIKRLFSFLDFRDKEEADTEKTAGAYRDPSTGYNNPVAKPWLKHYNDESYKGK